MKKSFFFVLVTIALLALLGGCSHSVEQTSEDQEVPIYSIVQTPENSKVPETTPNAGEYPEFTFGLLTNGTVKENDKFSIVARFDASLTRVFDTNKMMHQAVAKVGDDSIFFYFQTTPFDSKESADAFNFDSLDSLAGREGRFDFIFEGFDSSGNIPVAVLSKVDVDGVTYTSNDIGDIRNIRIVISAEVIDSVLYTAPEYHDGIYAAARIKNTGTVMLELSQYDCSFDIEDSDGNFIYHMDNLTVSPSVIGGDDIGYVVKLDMDTGVDLTKCKKLIVNLSYDSAYAIPGSLEVEDVSMSEYSGSFYATPGRVVNNFKYDIEDVTPIVSFLDKTGKFLGVNIDSSRVSIKGEGKMGFSGKSYNPIPLSAFSKEDVGSIKATGSFFSVLE